MEKILNRKIVLEDGSEFPGTGFGHECDKVCELVFNTAMVGYQEIVSDPSYTYQMVVMTYPLIGNYGIADDDFETKIPTIGGLIVREYNNVPSNFRYTKTLGELLEEYEIPGISGIDTRMLTRKIRDNGTCKVLITSAETPHDKAMEILNSTEIPTDAVQKVSCKKKWYSRTAHPKLNVVALDCGIKLYIIRTLNKLGCNVTVVPYDTTAEEIAKLNPDGILFSNGPGSPENLPNVVELIKELKGKYPIFGISLGHQLISLAYGAKISKLKFGHRGGNHPVKNLETGKIEIVNQNHSYTVDAQSIEATDLVVTHTNILDNTVAGVACEKDKVIGVQYHPESAYGHQYSHYLFNKFIGLMKEGK